MIPAALLECTDQPASQAVSPLSSPRCDRRL